jgi:integrase/recombinase XerD
MKIVRLVANYLAYKRALGVRCVSEGFVLRSFCRHLGNVTLTNIAADRVLAFLHGGHGSNATAARKYRVLTGLDRYLCVRYRRTHLPLPRALRERSSSFVPYIYSHEELKRLLDATVVTCSGRAFIEDYVLRALLLVLYGAGLRISEAVALNEADVDLEQAVLTIRRTKFYKSRLVPLGHDLSHALRAYRRRHGRRHPQFPETPFFTFYDGRRVSISALRLTFRRLRTIAGVHRKGGARRQPRIHDLRHTAAVHRVIQWYRSGADMQSLLPRLATYLGHGDLSSTQRYLTLTPQLLHEASLRFERYAFNNQNE